MKHEDQLVVSVFKLARLLVRKQLKAGSWEDSNPSLNSIVITTQATLLLSEFKCTFFDKSTEKACLWLSKPDVASSQYSYWRLLPLICCHYDNDSLEKAWSHVKQNVVENVLHHPNSPLKTYLVHCGVLLKKKDDPVFDEQLKSIKESLHNLNEDFLPEVVSYRLAVYTSFDLEGSLAILDNAIGHIKKKGYILDDRIHWASLVTTSYIALNLIETRDLLFCNQCQALDSLIEKSINYIFSEYTAGHLDSPLLAGGEKEINGKYYVSIVCCRALSAYLNMIDVGWQQRYWATSYRRLLKSITIAIPFILGLCLLCLGRLFEFYGTKTSFNLDLLSVSADIIAMLTFAYGLCRWLIFKYFKYGDSK